MKTNDMTMIAILLALLILCSQFALPIGPVPITLQTLAVLMIGYLMSPKNALMTTLLYLLIGISGMPVFSSFSGGFQTILYPSFGFVLSFIPASYLQAKYLKNHENPSAKQLILAGILNFLVTYTIGLSYMTWILNVYLQSSYSVINILMLGFIPFVFGDLLKIILAVTLAKQLIPILRK